MTLMSNALFNQCIIHNDAADRWRML